MLDGKHGETKSQNESQFLEEYCVSCFCSQGVIFNVVFSLLLHSGW